VKTAVILASGPSLTQEQINAAAHSGYFTIAVNSTWEKMPAANVLYSGDFLWWKGNIAKVRAAKFKGKLYTQDSSAAARWTDIKRVRGGNRPGLGKEVIHINGNSGTQAVNLAYIWGYDRHILLGFDLKLGPNGEKHHHADHPAPMIQGQLFDEWLKKWVPVARDLKAAKIEVINCTPGSALTLFPMKDWKEVLL
jgi:hypothetical protein